MVALLFWLIPFWTREIITLLRLSFRGSSHNRAGVCLKVACGKQEAFIRNRAIEFMF